MTDLVKSINIKTRSEFDRLLNNSRPNEKEALGRVIFGGMSYAKAGAPYNMSKQHIYNQLKKLEKDKDVNTNAKNNEID